MTERRSVREYCGIALIALTLGVMILLVTVVLFDFAIWAIIVGAILGQVTGGGTALYMTRMK